MYGRVGVQGGWLLGTKLHWENKKFLTHCYTIYWLWRVLYYIVICTLLHIAYYITIKNSIKSLV